MQVTDIKRIKNKGKPNEFIQTGFYMDGFLKENIDPIPAFLKNDWDCVGIVSGHGKVRIGKSTIAAQIAYYIAWRIAGGVCETNEKRQVIANHPPKNPVRFNLKENMVFSAEQLQERAVHLYEKYGKNQVILYDEGRQGTDSSRTMESVNKGMEDFFQECGFMNHVIIICLPNFFKLHEDYAVARSLFLVDVFVDRNFRRGYFNFYNERQKEYLYFFGKKRLGVMAKYSATNESFYGRYGKWFPFNKKEYNEVKKREIEKKRVNRREKNWKLQRDLMLWVLHHKFKMKWKEIIELFDETIGIKPERTGLTLGVQNIQDIMERQKGIK